MQAMTREDAISLTEYWKNFDIRKAIENIYELWQEVLANIKRAMWKYLLPYSVKWLLWHLKRDWCCYWRSWYHWKGSWLWKCWCPQCQRMSGFSFTEQLFSLYTKPQSSKSNTKWLCTTPWRNSHLHGSHLWLSHDTEGSDWEMLDSSKTLHKNNNKKKTTGTTWGADESVIKYYTRYMHDLSLITLQHGQQPQSPTLSEVIDYKIKPSESLQEHWELYQYKNWKD